MGTLLAAGGMQKRRICPDGGFSFKIGAKGL